MRMADDATDLASNAETLDASEAPEPEPKIGLAFADLTVETLEALSDALDVSAKLDLICEVVQVQHYRDNCWSGVFVDYLYYGLAFCGERGYADDQASALFSILKRVFEDAFPLAPQSESRTLEESHACFKQLMLAHSVDDADHGCVGLFSVAEVEAAAEFLSTTFYRHYKMYQYAYSTDQPEETVHHALVVETPLPPPPLADGALYDPDFVEEECVEAPAPAPYYEEDHVEYYGADPEYLETYKAYVKGRREDAQAEEDPSLVKARAEAMVHLAQLKADEESGKMAPMKWTVVEPDALMDPLSPDVPAYAAE